MQFLQAVLVGEKVSRTRRGKTGPEEGGTVMDQVGADSAKGPGVTDRGQRPNRTQPCGLGQHRRQSCHDSELAPKVPQTN